VVDQCRWLMLMITDMPIMVKEDMGVIRRTMVVCRSPMIDKLLFSIIDRVYFMYEFYLIWN